MSLFRTLDRTSAVSCPHSSRPFLAFVCPVLCNKTSRRTFSKSAVNRPPRMHAAGERMDNLFIQALARAASCPEHAKQISTQREVPPLSITCHKTRRKTVVPCNERREFMATKAGRTPFTIAKQFAEKELKALVDYYGMELAAPSSEEEVEDEGSLIWNVGDSHVPWPVKDAADSTTIAKLDDLLRHEDTPHEEIFDTYKLLPAPGVVYLTTETIHNMLRHLSIVERPTPEAMQRYLSILDDMKEAHIHIKATEWTSAIYFAGRSMGASPEGVQSALYLWRDMEQRAGVRAGHVTFNVLFDIAVKAGKYTLAETFLKEMHVRGLKFHRHFRVSLIYYHGAKNNGAGVRQAYKELVESGDIVDTVVMNAVIAALIRAREPEAAEQVFERMKRLSASKTTPFPGTRAYNNRNWREQRILGLDLTYEGRRLTYTEDLEARKLLQDWAPIAPNSRTYSLLIRHHASTTGNLDRVNALLREMGYNSVPLEGSIYIVMFHGFENFGGVRYTSWTRGRLEQTWREYLQAVDSGLPRTWVSQMAVLAALRAFRKCADGERTVRAWEEIRVVWRPSREEVEGVVRVLRDWVGLFDKMV